MKRVLYMLLVVWLSSAFSAVAQDSGRGTEYPGKSVYLPAEIADNDFSDPDSKWSFSRMVSTDNVVLFWAPGFGDNITTAPPLEGQDMKVDLANLLDKLERFYRFFYNDLQFVRPGSKADRYKMMVMLDYSLEGTAYGGTYDNEIGALWITPNRVKDSALNCIAHELGHSFQLQVIADGAGEAWGGCGFYEMASQWMLWQVNPDWQRDEEYHLDAFRKLTHKALLHIDNIYHSPYVLEFWGEKHGVTLIGELFRQGKVGEDPVVTYKRVTGTSQSAFNDELWSFYARMINWDIPRVRDNTRRYANNWNTELEDAGGGWRRVCKSNCPENYGFNAIPLPVPGKGRKIKVDFRGETGYDGYVTLNKDKEGWRYGIVAVDAAGKSHYGKMHSSKNGTVTYAAPADEEISHLWLVVSGAPREHWRNVDGPDNPGDAQWPYSIRIR